MYLKLLTRWFRGGVIVSVVAIAMLSGNAFAANMDPAQATAGATKIYTDLQSISNAVEQYRLKHGIFPTGSIEVLVNEGLLVLPTIGADLGGGSYEIASGFDDMDGQGEMDDAIYVKSHDIPIEVCTEYNKLYAGAPLNDGTIFDWEAADATYPGKVFGRQMKTFAIKFASSRVNCQINWVVEYK